jgi:AAA domain-containing protein
MSDDIESPVERGRRIAQSGKHAPPLICPVDDDPDPTEPDFEPPPAQRNGNQVRNIATPAYLRYPTLDWDRVFEGLPDDVDWLVPEFLVRGASYSLVSAPKDGKSLLLLEIAAARACGREVLGHPAMPPIDVLYADYENSRDDLTERLRDMGYNPADLRRLHYLSFPAMPPLDGPAGGHDLCEIAAHYDAQLVVIDTVSRVVAGEENSADTYRNLYRHTLLPLKSQRRTVVRLDHRGKRADDARARGSSAKNDDVDAVWQLSQSPGPNGETYVTLKLERQRGSAHPDIIRVLRDVNPRLHHKAQPPPVTLSDQERIAHCIDAMVRLRLPPDTGARKARTALRDSGYKVRNDTVAAAVKARKAMCPRTAATSRDTLEIDI